MCIRDRPGKTRIRNDLLCVEWDVKPYTLSHSLTPILSKLREVFNDRSIIRYGQPLTVAAILFDRRKHLSVKMQQSDHYHHDRPVKTRVGDPQLNTTVHVK